MARCLLIVSCSDAKTFEEEPIPAIRRYNGPLWQTLRSTLETVPASAWPAIAALSAEHGLIAADTPIADYDRRMDEARAAELARDPGFRSALAELSSGKERIYVAGGKLYRDTVTLANAFLGDRTPIEGANEATTIGFLRQQMREWLLHAFLVETRTEASDSEIEKSVAPEVEPDRLAASFKVTLGVLMRSRAARDGDVDVGALADEIRSAHFPDLSRDGCVALTIRSLALYNTLADPDFEAPLAADPDGARPIAMAIAAELPVLLPGAGSFARFRKESFVARFVRAVVDAQRAP